MAHSLAAEIESKYEILEKLQVGGMGAIYKVRHRLLGDVRVVKVLRPQLMDDESFHKRFLREARAATRLIHPNVARLYDFSVDEMGAAHMVMEYIEGSTLGELIARGELPPLGLALEIARQGLTAIGHLHGHRMIHRDVSPDNLMLTRDVDGRPLVKLIDLGLAKSVTGSEEGITAKGMFVGKFRYAAPEHFLRQDEHPVGPRSDLYSFGVVLYELVTGRYPIVGDTAQALIAGHLYHPPRDFADTDREGRVPEGLRAAILQALAKDPGDRFASAEGFAAALEPIASRAENQAPGAAADSQPVARPAATGAVEKVEEKIVAADFAAARKELRRALETTGETPELLELGERIDEMERIGRARQAEAGLETVAKLRAEGRLREALDETLRLSEIAPAHKLVRLVAREIEKDLAKGAEATEEVDEVALLPTTPFQVRSPAVAAEDEAALAPTELLPTAGKTSAPPVRRALAAEEVDVRRFDEISLRTIPHLRPTRRGPSRRFMWTAVALFVTFLLLGIALASLI